MLQFTGKMSKKYGLIIPGQKQKKFLPTPSTTVRPTNFEKSSDSDSDESKCVLPKLKKCVSGSSIMERRMTKRIQEKALAEDPTIFQYDELYDNMEGKHETDRERKRREPRQAKYIGRLMEHAERRKLENELRIERQVQKERETEGEMYKDKETYVTSAYRKKLEEMRKLQEQEKRDEYLEAIGDVTKQKNLDGFYRHIYEQKTGIAKAVPKPDVFAPSTTATNEQGIGYTPIKSQKLKPRSYRKRQASAEENDDKPSEINDGKKVHLPNNIDADSDFSIDSSTEDENNENTSDVKHKMKTESIINTMEEQQTISVGKQTEEAVGEVSQSTSIYVNDRTVVVASVETETKEVQETPKTKIDKKLIWQKRTIGEVYEAAMQRYFKRKAARDARDV